jgi:hypothetical protein
MDAKERQWRFREAVRARMPYTCPRCSSGGVRPMFWPGLNLLWGCVACRAIFCESS